MNRRHRLRGRGRFAAIRRVGVEARFGAVRVRALRNDLAWPRAGIVVLGARGAVERNRLRRRLRAAVRSSLPVEGCDSVVSVHARAGAYPAADLWRDVAQALQAAAAKACA